MSFGGRIGVKTVWNGVKLGRKRWIWAWIGWDRVELWCWWRGLEVVGEEFRKLWWNGVGFTR